MVVPVLSGLLLLTICHAIIPEVKKDPCIDLILCTLESDKNYCELYHGSQFVVVVDRNRWNIAEEQKNRSIIHKYGDYGCATIRNLQESDTGNYVLRLAKEDGILHLRETFSLSGSVLKCLLNVSSFNVNTSKIDVGLPIYKRKTDTELPEPLQLTAGNGTIPADFSLALVVTVQDPATEKPMDVTTPTGTTPPPRNAKTDPITIIVGSVSVFVVIFIGTIAICYCIRTPANNNVI